MAVFVALLAAYIDWISRLEFNVSVLYGLPLVLAIPTRNRRLLWGMTAFLLIATFAAYALQSPPGDFSPADPFFIDRLLSAATVLLIAILLHSRMLALDTMEAQRRMLEQQNEELDHRRGEAEEATRRKTRLLASASHDLRTPVYAITLIAEAIRASAGKPSSVTRIPELVEHLQADALALDRLISDLLDATTFDAGRIAVHESIVSLHELLLDQCARLRPLAEAKGLRLEVEMPAEPVWLRTDRVKLARVVSNLLENAIKFTRSGGVTVSLRLLPEEVLVSVRDTGTGIAADQLDIIFDEFAKLQTGADSHGEGWGLGLPICRRLMEALGGRITVESEPGGGSTFVLRLPARFLAGACATTAL